MNQARVREQKLAKPDWNPSGKGWNATRWEQVRSLMAEHPTVRTEQLVKLADCSVATVYRIKRERTRAAKSDERK